MIRKLLIVFVSGLVLSVLLLSSAWVIGGKELVARAERDYGGWSWHRDRHGKGHGDMDGPATNRSLPFDASQVLTIDAPVTLHFARGPEVRMTVSGPGRVIDRLRCENGRLSLGGKGGRWFGGPLDVTITAPQLAGLVLHGASDVELNGLDQPALTIDAHGAVELDANGRVQTLSVSSHGAGDLDLKDVEVNDATVRIAGVGDVEISATGKVDAAISGAGDVSLHRKPAQLTSSISGFGSIQHEY